MHSFSFTTILRILIGNIRTLTIRIQKMPFACAYYTACSCNSTEQKLQESTKGVIDSFDNIGFSIVQYIGFSIVLSISGFDQYDNIVFSIVSKMSFLIVSKMSFFDRFENVGFSIVLTISIFRSFRQYQFFDSFDNIGYSIALTILCFDRFENIGYSMFFQC